MSRSVPEWIGRTDDAKVPDRVRLRIWRRQCGPNQNFTICPLSGLPLRDTDAKHLHHALALCLGGEHREFNLYFVHAKANMDEAKKEVAIRARDDAKALAHAGIRTAPKRKMQSRGFAKVEKAKKKSSGKVMQRRGLYR